MNLNSLSFLSFSVSLAGGGGGEFKFALLVDSLLARSDWNQVMLSARAERTLAMEAKRSASSLLDLVILAEEGVAVGGWERIWWFARRGNESEELAGESLRSLLVLEMSWLRVVERLFVVAGTI